MDAQGEMKEDVNIPTQEHLKDKAALMRSLFEKGDREILVTVLATLGKE